MKVEATLYEMLEVSPQAGAQVIRATYRCLAQRNHPDKNPGSEAAIECQAQINFAYSVLSDARKRWHYDQRLGTPQGSAADRRGKEQATPAHAKARDGAPPVSRAFAFRPFI